MKRSLVLLAVLAVVGTCVVRARSDEPNELRVTEASSQVRLLESKLIDTLEKAFDASLEEYSAGRTAPTTAIRLNEDLFDQEISAAHGDPERIADRYLARAKRIESSARGHYAYGIGTKRELLQAEAARLKAELATLKHRS